MEHLIGAGHRRNGFLGDRPPVFTAAERRTGDREALAAAGIAPDESLERVGLARPENPVAIRAPRALGREHDVALVSFDDVDLGELLEPGTTVVQQDPYAHGKLRFARTGGHAAPPEPAVLPARLVTRSSGAIALARTRA